MPQGTSGQRVGVGDSVRQLLDSEGVAFWRCVDMVGVFRRGLGGPN